MRSLTGFFLLASLLVTFGQYPDCQGTVNNQAIIDTPPQLVATVTNGNKYIIQNPDNTTALTIVAAKGSAYDMGYAYGQLMKDELNDAIPGMFQYLVNQTETWMSIIQENLPFYLQWIPNLLSLNSSALLTAALSLQHQVTAPFTPQRFTQELQGIAAASGIDLTLLTNINMVPEFVRAQCSMAGVWGSASYDSNLLQLRALDWDYSAYIVRHPTITVYFSDEEGSNPFANLGFAGIIGAISGYSTKVAVSEKLWAPPPTDPMSYFGEPFPYILRNILQFGNDIQSSVDYLFNTPRTCSVYVGIGSQANNSFEGLAMSYDELIIWNDKNYSYYSDSHPQMDGVFYLDNQDVGNRCFGSILKQNYGKIDPEVIFRQATALTPTGDTQVIVYQFENNTIYIAYSDPINGIKAYTRPLHKVDMGELLTYENLF